MGHPLDRFHQQRLPIIFFSPDIRLVVVLIWTVEIRRLP
jgi:hypothetical protein